jgi:hypothetical protein
LLEKLIEESLDARDAAHSGGESGRYLIVDESPAAAVRFQPVFFASINAGNQEEATC